MPVLEIVLIAGGLLLLIAGGESLVRGAIAISDRAGISPLVAGLTVVSVATSMPELAVTLSAVLTGQPDLAVGNVVGSNIANILLVLGATALVGRIVTARGLFRLDLPLLLLASVLLLVLGLDGRLGPLDGLVLLAILLTHMAISVRTSRRAGRAPVGEGVFDADPADGQAVPEPEPAPGAVDLGRALVQVALGVGLLVGGAALLVEGAVGIATALHVSELAIGLTVVAVGTSLPELATSMVAMHRGHRDIALGNVVGSNLANLGLVLGIPALIGGGVPVAGAALSFDIPVMIAVTVALVPLAATRWSIQWAEGLLLVLLYGAYTAYVLLTTTQHDALAGYRTVLLWWVLPILGATLVVDTVLEFLRRRRL